MFAGCTVKEITLCSDSTQGRCHSCTFVKVCANRVCSAGFAWFTRLQTADVNLM